MRNEWTQESNQIDAVAQAVNRGTWVLHPIDRVGRGHGGRRIQGGLNDPLMTPCSTSRGCGRNEMGEGRRSEKERDGSRKLIEGERRWRKISEGGGVWGARTGPHRQGMRLVAEGRRDCPLAVTGRRPDTRRCEEIGVS